MGLAAIKANGVDGAASSVVWKVGCANTASGLLGTGIIALVRTSAAGPFAIGFVLGLLNAFWLLRIARRGVQMTPEKAGRFVAISYYIRFAATAAVFIALLLVARISPWPMLAGLTCSVFTTVAVMIFLAREEAS